MITVDQMIKMERKNGEVTHLALSRDVASLCGRLATAQGQGKRLCRTCSKIAKVADTQGEWTAAQQHFINLSRSAEQWAQMEDVITDYEGGMDNDPARIALYRAALARRNYATTVITGDLDKGARRGDGNVIGGGKAKRMGATENQRIALRKMGAYVDSLVNELAELQGKEKDGNTLSAILTDEHFDGLTRSNIQAYFSSLPVTAANLKTDIASVSAEKRKTETPRTTDLTEKGIYFLDGKFYRMKRAQAGHLYPIVWDGERWNYSATERGISKRITAENAVTPEQAKIWADIYHNCCFCHHPLNDTRSENAGYGPDCADKYGLPWGE